jgi:predicted dehydrogenase
MFLSPEDRAIGKENFSTAIGSEPIRRKLLLESVKKEAKSGKGLGSLYFKYGESVPEPLKVGILGVGEAGQTLIGAINKNYLQVKSIADIRPYNVWRAFNGDVDDPKSRPGLMKVFGWKTEEEAKTNVKVYAGYDELLKAAKDDGIEAVIIALPLHLHAPAAVAAMKAGLHVFTETLMAHSVRQCKEMARVAKDANLLLAVGHQRRYNILYDNAAELLRSGLLGELHYIRAQWSRAAVPGNDDWQPPMPKEAKPDDAQAGVLQAKIDDYDDLKKKEAEAKSEREKEEYKKKREALEMKLPQIREQMKDLVDAKKYGYEDLTLKNASGNAVYERPAVEELFRWRLWDRTGAGMMAELGCHLIDAADLFVTIANQGKRQRPLSVSASCGRLLSSAEKPDRESEDHVYCILEYPGLGYDPKNFEKSKKKIGLQCAMIGGNDLGGYGETIFGTTGTLLLDNEKEALLYKGADTGMKIRVVQPKDKTKPPVMQEAKEEDAESAGFGTLGVASASRGFTEELEHFAWCVRNRAPENAPLCTAETALADAVIALTASRAAREGIRIDFKDEWFDPASDETPEGEKPDVARYNTAETKPSE